jgi:hypothetical protein
MNEARHTTFITIPPAIMDARFALQDAKLELAHVGQGHWRAFRALGLDIQAVREIAVGWQAELGQISHPWLCWNVDEDWCLIQQRLVQSVGWTPLVGFDPRVGPPRKLAKGAIVFDFNSRLGLPLLYPHFPLEFCFAFCDRLAFWHSDLLIRPGKMQALADRFRMLRDGETAASWASPGWRHIFSEKHQRFWELVGCTTRGASLDQFNKGCGWWMGYWAHPNCAPADSELIRKKYYWDHGAGVYFWSKRKGGSVTALASKHYEEGHFTKIGNTRYVRTTPLRNGSDAERSMSDEIRQNFDLQAACRKLDLLHLLDA